MSKTKATQLTDADVNFVSVVSRGANRIPFRITKSDEGKNMIDFSKIFKFETPNPAVTAIAVSKNADLDGAKARIEGAGYSVEKMEESDQGYIFHQEDAATEQAVTIKVDEDIAFVVSNVSVQKMFEGWNYEDTIFADVMKTEGIYPSISTAREVLSNTIYNILGQAESSTQAASAITKASADFGEYVSQMVSSIPSKAFKMDNTEVLSSVDGPDNASGTKESEVESGDTDVDADAVAKTDEGEGEESVEKEDVSSGISDEDDTKKTKKGKGKDKSMSKESEGEESVEKEEEADGNTPEDTLASVQELVETLTDTLTGQISALTKSVDAKLASMSKKVDETAQLAKSADEAVSGFIPGSEGVGDKDKTHKSDKDEWSDFVAIDTGTGQGQDFLDS